MVRKKQDQPYVAHYDWSAIPGVEDPDRLTPEQTAVNEQHARDRESLERGHTLRLLLAAPLAVFSVAGMAVIALAILTVALWAVGRESLISDLTVTPVLVAFLVIVVCLEIATIRVGAMLMRDRVDTRAWSTVLALSAGVTVAIGAWLLAITDEPAEAWIGFVAGAYSTLIAATQIVRSRRVADAARRIDEFSP